MFFRVVNGNGYFLYGKESIRMLPWQIVDLEGHPYYAFLPASDIPKSAETSQCDDLKQYDSQVSEISIVKEEQEDCAIASDVDDTACNDILDDYYSANVKHSTPSTKETAPAVGKNELDEIALNENDDSKVYNCDECNTCFPVLRMLKQHWKTVHQGKAPQCKCSLCPAICRNPVALETHVDLEHRNERRKTDDGPASTDQPKTYRCEFCDHECDNKSALHSHISKKHPQILQPRNKPRDVKAAVEQEEYTCDTCGFKFPNRRRLKEHLERKHASGYKYNCEFCPKKFKVKSDMRLHVRFKHKENPIVCDVCGKTCANSNSLYVHQKWAHFKPKYECEICKRRMVSQENLDQHILLQHERKESFVCEECGKSFSENHRLKQHRLTHTGDRPYDCHICGRAFARRTAYRQHLLIHTGKRPYVCDICGKAFTQKPGLICHRKSHPGVHPPLPIVYIDHILNDFMKNK